MDVINVQELAKFLAWSEAHPLGWVEVFSLLLQSVCLLLLLAVRSAACRILRGSTRSNGGRSMLTALGRRAFGNAQRASPIRGRRSAPRNLRRSSDGTQVPPVGPEEDVQDIAARVGVSVREVREAISRRAAHAADTAGATAGSGGAPADADSSGSAGAYVPPAAR